MQIELETTVVRLRTFCAGDVDPLFEAASESVAELSPWLPWCQPGYRRQESQSFVESRGEAWQQANEYSFLIEDPKTGRFLGGCAINQIDLAGRRANLGYWVRTCATGRGLATAATRRLARWGFDTFGLQRIEIVAAVGNLPSRRVAEKAGAVFECIARRRIRIGEQQVDAACYSLIPEDLELEPTGMRCVGTGGEGRND